MGHEHHHHHQHSGSKNILTAFFLNAGFAIIELVGGYLTNSVAIYSDALHDFGDSLALLFAYFSEKLSHKKADEHYTFGYRRFSILSALVSGVILLSGSSFVIYESISRIVNPEPVVAEGMIGLAVLGILVNSYAAYRMSNEEGVNSKMVKLHLLEDLLGWIAVLVVSVILLFKPWYILDSIISLFISTIIIRGVYKNLIRVGSIFLQKFPRDLEMSKIREEILKVGKVQDLHALKGWSLDGESHYLCFHVSLPAMTTISEVDQIKLKIKSILSSYSVETSTIEFEGIDNCKD